MNASNHRLHIPSLTTVGLLLLALGACGDDADPPRDAGGGTTDSGAADRDAGMDSGVQDAGETSDDAGSTDAGDPDAGPPDAGSDGGPVVVVPDAGGDCTADLPSDFGDMCFDGTECDSGSCWMGPLVAGECQLAGCTAPCETDAQCQCYAEEAGAEDPEAASCVEGTCDLEGTSLGGVIICT